MKICKQETKDHPYFTTGMVKFFMNKFINKNQNEDSETWVFI